MTTQPMQPLFSGGDPKTPGKIGKAASNFFWDILFPLGGFLLVGWLVWTYALVPIGGKISDGAFAIGDNTILRQNQWTTIPGKPWTTLDIKAENPAEEKYLYGQISLPGGKWTPVMSLQAAMALEIRTPEQVYVRVGMGSSAGGPESVRVLVTYCGIPKKL